MLELKHIEIALRERIPFELGHHYRTMAAVALILVDDPTGQAVLFLERSLHGPDPWSGNLGFPGGKFEPNDADLQATAERETHEELGLDLRQSRFLGRLDDLLGAHLPVMVACFVYYVPILPQLKLSHEVRRVFTVPVSALLEPSRRIETTVHFQGDTLDRPAIRLPVPGQDILWGISYRLVMNLIEILTIKCGERPSDGT